MTNDGRTDNIPAHRVLVCIVRTPPDTRTWLQNAGVLSFPVYWYVEYCRTSGNHPFTPIKRHWTPSNLIHGVDTLIQRHCVDSLMLITCGAVRSVSMLVSCISRGKQCRSNAGRAMQDTIVAAAHCCVTVAAAADAGIIASVAGCGDNWAACCDWLLDRRLDNRLWYTTTMNLVYEWFNVGNKTIIWQ